MDKVKRNKDIQIFLDSGAFTAFTQGVEIRIEDYIAFIKEHKDVLTVYANLDVIGDPKATLNNQRIMERAGLSPLPCFHYGEPIKYLLYYLERYEYVALGGMVPISTRDLQVWLDELFSKYICDKDGMPKCKIHGFGLTSHRLMLRYPWYSVDSTSWVITGRMGLVYVPRYRKGVPDYTERPWRVTVSTRSPGKKEAGMHIDTYSKMERDVIERYFKDKGYVLGKSSFKFMKQDKELKENERWAGKPLADGTREVEVIHELGLSNDYRLRDELNIIYFTDLEKNIQPWPWAFKLSTCTGFSL